LIRPYTAILSLIGENDILDDGIEAALDDILQSSLWQRRLLRQNEQVQQVLKAGLVARSRLIWAQSTAQQRKGYFLAGVGLTTGHALDAIAADANLLLVHANAALSVGDAEAAIIAITSLAERLFAFYPYTPDPMPDNWRDIAAGFSASHSQASLPDRNPTHSNILVAFRTMVTIEGHSATDRGPDRHRPISRSAFSWFESYQAASASL